MFIIIICSIIVVQVILVQFTQDVFQWARKGLIWSQWLFWIGVALTVFPVNFVTKFIPESFMPKIGSKKKKIEDMSVEVKNYKMHPHWINFIWNWFQSNRGNFNLGGVIFHLWKGWRDFVSFSCLEDAPIDGYRER